MSKEAREMSRQINPPLCFTKRNLAFLCIRLIFLARLAHTDELPGTENIQLQTFSSHSRLTFRVDDSVEADWKPTVQGFQVFFKGLNYSDFGAPFGHEEKWAAQSREIHDPRLSEVRFREVPGGLMVEGNWKFATGPQAPAEPKMETFNFRDRNPSRLVVDFWVKKGPTFAEVQALEKQRAREASAKKIQNEIKTRIQRRIASEKAKASLDVVDEFCRKPLSEEKDVFLPFLPVHEKVDFSKWISLTTPDAQFPYYEPSSKARDAQYVRLALNLYRKGDYALVIRTLDFLDSEYPASKYHQEMRFLRANTLLKLDLNADAEHILERLRTEAKNTPVALHSAMYLARRLMERQSPLAANEAFLWLVDHYPAHNLNWVFHLGSAESLYSIKQTDRAAKEYAWIIENAPGDDEKGEAALRFGDLYLERRQYEQAYAEYSRALRIFPKQAAHFPALALNRAEALYQMGKYSEVQKQYEDYLEQFSSYPEGWRATFRLGEIFGRRPGAENEAASRKWFYETVNRYPFSPGSTLARLRLLPCGDHGGYDYAAASRFLESEAMSFDAPTQVSMVHYSDLRMLAHVRSLITLNREDLAVDLAAELMEKPKIPEVKSSLRKMFSQLLRRNVLAFLRQGKKYEAIKFYSDREKYFTKGVTVDDPDYLLKLSYAASDLGLGNLGEQLAARYQEVSGKDRTLATAQQTAEKPPTDLDTKLQAAEKAFAEAKAIWVGAQGQLEAEDETRVKAQLAQVTLESPYSFEKEIILGLMDQKAKKTASARNHAVQAQLLMPASSSSEQTLRIAGWLAGLEASDGDVKVAFEMYRNLEKRLADRKGEKPESATKAGKSPLSVAELLGVPEAPSMEFVFLEQGRLLEKLGRWGESAGVYSRAMDAGLGGNQAMFSYARALLKDGGQAGREKAIAMLEKLAVSKVDDFWKKLAIETLEDQKRMRR